MLYLREKLNWSILVVTWNNELIELYTPFKVLVNHDIGKLKEGENASVNTVKLTTNLKTVFVIEDYTPSC